MDSDWAVTGLFYAALHYVDAYLARANMHPAVHEERDRMIKADPKILSVRSHYGRLKDRSSDARCNPSRFAAPDITELRTRDLEPIKGALT